MTETKENCRKQTGNLKINNQLYPIYEGLNIIGRDLKATVTLKETIFSKLHAAISVVNTHHLICDLNSSNGTQLGRTKLIPYKFYPIKDYEPIVFGDVVGMYFIGAEIQNNCVIKVSTQNFDPEAETQILNNINSSVENIHDLPTQQFDIHEAATENFDDANNIHEASTENIHEAPTQIFPETNKTTENLQDLEEKEVNKETNNDQTNESNYNIDDNSDDDATQDLVPNIDEVPKMKDKEKSTQDLETSKKLDVEDANKNPEIRVSPVDDILSHSDVYVDIFANETFRSNVADPVDEFDVVEVDETVLVQSQKNAETTDEFKKSDKLETKSNVNENGGMSDDDDIILSTQDSEAIDQKYREHQEEINSTKEKLNEDACDSDATDIEDEQLLMANIPYLEQDAKTPDIPVVADITNDNVIIENNIDEHSDEEELDLLASTASKSDSNTEELVKNDESLTRQEKLIPAQLAETNEEIKSSDHETKEKELGKTNEEIKSADPENKDKQLSKTNEENKSSDYETDDELPATQLLHLNSNKQIQKVIPELDDNDDIYFAATQKITLEEDKNEETTEPDPKSKVAADETIDKENSLYSAPTQLLLNENAEEDIFSAETQFLLPENKKPVDSGTSKSKTSIENDDEHIFSAATQILPHESDTCKNKNGRDEDIFSVATQILPHESDTCKNQNEKDEDVFAAATQILPATGISKTTESTKDADDSIYSMATQLLEPIDNTDAKKITETTENDIFSAPTQVLSNPENENDVSPDDIFMAPTQILLDDEEETQKTSRESLLSSSESIDMRLHLSETEHSMPNLNEEKPKELVETEQQQNTETQLEVDFELETQKLYIEEKTSRPNNPLSHLFAEQATEQFEDNDKNEDLSMSVDSATKLQPIVSIVDIKKSKITLKDIQEASTSKIKKSYVKLERIRQEPTRKSSRNRKESSESQEDSEKVASNSETNEPVINEAKTPRRRTRMTISEAPTPKVSKKEEIAVKEDKPTKRRAAMKTSTPAVPEIKKTKSVKKEEEEVTNEEKEHTLEITSEASIVNDGDGDFKVTPNRPHTRGKRRDYKSIANGDSEIVAEIKIARSKITSKSFMKEKIEELEIHVKEDKTEPAPSKNIDDEDSNDSVFRSKRVKHSKREAKEENSEKNEDSDGSSIEIKIRKKVPRIEESQPEPRPKRTTKTRARQASVEEVKETKEERPRRGTRNTRRTTKSIDHDNQDPIVIEDSDESILETYKKLPETKIEEVEESAKVPHTPQIMQTRKRNSQLSPERSKTTQSSSDICLNTPNSKRRRYEPLSVNISSYQLNNESEHKVVFTMLNDTSLENIVRKLGGSVVDAINSCTVLVTNKISRSLKFLIAVALGKPIVHVKWILDSDKKKKFLDPWNYLLEDPESEAKFKMSLKESLTKSREKKLLSGETILLATSKNVDVLKEIIETSGGKCITRAPPKNSKTIVVCYEEEKSKYSRFLKQKTCTVVSAEAIFSGVLQQKINWKQYILS